MKIQDKGAWIYMGPRLAGRIRKNHEKTICIPLEELTADKIYKSAMDVGPEIWVIELWVNGEVVPWSDVPRDVKQLLDDAKSLSE